MNLKDKAKQLKTDIPALLLCLKDKDTPFIAKILAAITVAYGLSPIDLIPDFIPILGYLDDLILLPFMVYLTVKLIPEEVLKRNRQAAQNLYKDGKPKKWYYAVPVILIWVLIIYTIISKLIN